MSTEIGPESEQLLKTTWEQLLERGRAEGQSEGQARVLLKLLTQRFGMLPADVTERVRAASVEQLDVWAGNILGAKTLDEVFTTG